MGSAILSCILSVITLGSVYMTPVGHVGVVTQFGDVKYQVRQGIHMKAPLGIQSVYNFDTRVQKDDVKTEGASKDLQIVKMEVVANWHITPNKVMDTFQKVGTKNDVVRKIIAPAINEVIKASSAKYTAEEIITKRPKLKQDIDLKLSKRLRDYGVTLDDVSLVNIDFSPEFNKAIEEKQVAEQEAQKAQFIAEKAKKEAEAIVNKAKGEAEAQRLQQESLTPNLLQKLWIEKWDGKLPQYVTNGSPLLTIPK